MQTSLSYFFRQLTATGMCVLNLSASTLLPPTHSGERLCLDERVSAHPQPVRQAILDFRRGFIGVCEAVAGTARRDVPVGGFVSHIEDNAAHRDRPITAQVFADHAEIHPLLRFVDATLLHNGYGSSRKFTILEVRDAVLFDESLSVPAERVGAAAMEPCPLSLTDFLEDTRDTNPLSQYVLGIALYHGLAGYPARKPRSVKLLAKAAQNYVVPALRFFSSAYVFPEDVHALGLSGHAAKNILEIIQDPLREMREYLDALESTTSLPSTFDDERYPNPHAHRNLERFLDLMPGRTDRYHDLYRLLLPRMSEMVRGGLIHPTRSSRLEFSYALGNAVGYGLVPVSRWINGEAPDLTSIASLSIGFAYGFGAIYYSGAIAWETLRDGVNYCSSLSSCCGLRSACCRVRYTPSSYTESMITHEAALLSIYQALSSREDIERLGTPEAREAFAARSVDAVKASLARRPLRERESMARVFVTVRPVGARALHGAATVASETASLT